MIEDLIRVFEKKYKMYGDDLLLEDYKLEDGIYVLYNLNKADKPLTEFEVSKENGCVDNKYYKNRGIRIYIEKSRIVTKIYCIIYNAI